LLVVTYTPAKDDKARRAQNKSLTVLRRVIKQHAELRHEEVGNVLRVMGDDGISHPIEPFGYRDALSQPVYYETVLHERRERLRVNRDRWEPFAPLRLTLCRDPKGRHALSCGTYVVLRKLEQNVEKFYQLSGTKAPQERARRVQDGRLPSDATYTAEDLRNELVGRRRDGTPLACPENRFIDDFDYSEDPNGKACPFFAHVRKVNPRADVNSAWSPKERRILRRGVPYGPRIARDDDGKPTDGKVTYEKGEKKGPMGLMFLCAQANIAEQFEFLQSRWANPFNHPRGKRTATDPVIGQGGGLRANDMAPVVQLKGVEYFFAPSISCLRGLLDDLLNPVA